MSISTLQQYEVLSESGHSDIYSSDIAMRNELPSSQPEYNNLLDSKAPQMSEPDSLIISPSEMNYKPIHTPVTPNLPPRPILLPKKYASDSIQNNHEATQRLNTAPSKSCTRSRCISPSPSIVSTSSLCSQKSNSLQRCKYTPKSTTQTLRRPHVLHRRCSLNMAQLEQLSNTGSPTDIVVVYSKVCQVSADWARYFKALYESASYGKLCNKSPSSKSGVSIKVILQEVEEFSSKVYQLNSSTNNESAIRQELINLEERNYHAKCHIVIVGYHFLDWVYRNPSLIVGTLFGEINSGLGESGFDSTGSTIGLLLGVTAKDVKAEHRAALLTFQQWNLMNIEEDCSQLIDDDGHRIPTFSERLFKATIIILKKDEEKTKEQHYRIPSSIHMPAASPTYTLPQTFPSFSSKQDIDWVDHNTDPTFKILSNNLDVPSINALQRNLVLLLSHCVSSKDNIECYFVCVERTSKTDESSLILNMKDTSNLANKTLDTCTSSQQYQADKFEIGNSNEIAKQRQHAQEIETSLTNISEETFPSLPPKLNKSRRNSMNKFENGSEPKKSFVKLDFSCPSANIIEVDISKKVFSRLNTFLMYSKSEQEYCDKYIELTIKVNGKFCKPTKNIESGTNGHRIRIENPLSTLEHLMETSTLISESSLNWVNGMNKAKSYGLNQNLASIVSRNAPLDLFSWMLKYESNGSSKEAPTQEVMFPTLIHWAAYYGMDKLVVSLLNLPGSSIAAQQLNCKSRSSSEMAKDQGYLHIYELIESRISLTAERLSSGGDNDTPSKLTTDKMHVYEYPSVTFATYRGPIDTNDSNMNSPLPPQSNISPPPTPPSVSKLYDLKIEYEKYNRKSLRTSSSLSGESWTPSTNRSSTVSSGLVDIVNNDLYDIPRSSNYNSIAKCTQSNANLFDSEAPLSSESKKSGSDKLNEPVNHVDLTNEISNKPTSNTNTDTIDKKPIEYSYIPMQPRCNSTGQSSYSSSSTDNQNCRSESSPDYNSMGRKKKSSSASCVVSSSLSSSIVAIEKEISNDVKQENDLHASEAEEILLPAKSVLGLPSSPKPRHEFMKTYINFSNQEALLNDDYSPYTEKCDVKSLNEDPALSKASNLHDNVEKETLNTSDSGEKPATNLAMGFTPTFLSKLKKPIEKADSLTLPPKTPKRKGNKKERISSGSTPLAKFKIKRSGSLSSASNKPENFQNLSSEQFPDISKLMMSEPLDKPGEIDVNSDTNLIPAAMNEQEIISVTQNLLWSKLKGLSSGTLKRSKKRNRSENSTSS